MALPIDLQATITQLLPYRKFIQLKLADRFWLIRYAAKPEALQIPGLSSAEAAEQLAAYAGEPSLRNLNYLDPSIALIFAVQNSTFAEVLLRSAGEDLNNDSMIYVFLDALAMQKSGQDPTGEKLALLLATDMLPRSKKKLQVLSWGLKELFPAGRLPSKAYKQLKHFALVEQRALRSVRFRDFWRGYFHAHKYQPKPLDDTLSYCRGYLYGGGYSYSFLLTQCSAQIIAMLISYYNLSRLYGQPELSDLLLLKALNHQELAKLPRTGQRKFPTKRIRLALMPADELRKRAQALSFLLLQIYEPSIECSNYQLALHFILAPSTLAPQQLSFLEEQQPNLMIMLDRSVKSMDYFADFYIKGNGYYASTPLENLHSALIEDDFFEDAEFLGVRSKAKIVCSILPTIAYRGQLAQLPLWEAAELRMYFDNLVLLRTNCFKTHKLANSVLAETLLLESKHKSTVQVVNNIIYFSRRGSSFHRPIATSVERAIWEAHGLVFTNTIPDYSTLIAQYLAL